MLRCNKLGRDFGEKLVPPPSVVRNGPQSTRLGSTRLGVGAPVNTASSLFPVASRHLAGTPRVTSHMLPLENRRAYRLPLFRVFGFVCSSSPGLPGLGRQSIERMSRSQAEGDPNRHPVPRKDRCSLSVSPPYESRNKTGLVIETRVS